MPVEIPTLSLPEPKPQLISAWEWHNAETRAFLGKLYGVHLAPYGHEIGPGQEQLLTSLGTLACGVAHGMNVQAEAPIFKAAVHKTHIGGRLFARGYVMFGTRLSRTDSGPSEEEHSAFLVAFNRSLEELGAGHRLA